MGRYWTGVGHVWCTNIGTQIQIKRRKIFLVHPHMAHTRPTPANVAIFTDSACDLSKIKERDFYSFSLLKIFQRRLHNRETENFTLCEQQKARVAWCCDWQSF